MVEPLEDTSVAGLSVVEASCDWESPGDCMGLVVTSTSLVAQIAGAGDESVLADLVERDAGWVDAAGNLA